LFSAAPSAEVVVLGCPHLFIGSTPERTGRCLADGWILDTDQDWLNQVVGQIDSSLQQEASQVGFCYISTSSARNDSPSGVLISFRARPARVCSNGSQCKGLRGRGVHAF
jgi:hypothetical protein